MYNNPRDNPNARLYYNSKSKFELEYVPIKNTNINFVNIKPKKIPNISNNLELKDMNLKERYDYICNK